MIIFKDFISGDELFSDSYQYTEEGFWLKAEGQWREIGDVEVDIGANPSAEEAEEGVDSSKAKVVDIIDAFRLQETAFDKKGFVAAFKVWSKKVLEYLKEKRPGDVAPFQEQAGAAVKELVAKIKDLQFFTGESFDTEATLVFAYYADGSANPTFLFPRYALEEQKC